MPATRVLLADHQRSFAEALAMRLNTESALHVVSVAVSAEEALRSIRSAPADVAVLAVDEIDGGFVALGGTLQAERPELKLVGVTGGDDIPLLAQAVRQGFRGWVPKDVSIRQLLEVLQAVTRGETCIPPRMLTGLLEHLLRQESEPAVGWPFSTLTKRELEVLRAMSAGASRLEIAEELDISPNTVRTHLQKILTKLDVHTSLAAVTLGRRAGIV